MDEKERKIVKKSMEGNEKSLHRLLKQEGSSVLYMCIKLMGNQEDGEDAAQEVFLKIQKNISKLKSSQAYPVWVNRIIINTCLDMKARVQRKMEATSLEEYSEKVSEERKEFLPIEYAEQKELREKLLLAIDALPLTYRTVIVMYYYENLSQKEISEVMGISENAVSHRLRRARNDIKEKLEIEESENKKELTLSAGIPVLTKVLEIQCDSMVTPAQIKRLISRSVNTTSAKIVRPTGSATIIKVALSIAAVGILVSIAAWTSTENSAREEAIIRANEQLLDADTTQENSIKIAQGQLDSVNKPAISVKFSNATTSRSNVNPVECTIEVYDSPNAKVSWQIIDAEKNSVIAEGTEMKIKSETLKIDSDQDVKQYVLCVMAEAETGEVSQVEQIFTVTK